MPIAQPFEDGAQLLQTTIARWPNAPLGDREQFGDAVVGGFGWVKKDQLQEDPTALSQTAKPLVNDLLARPASKQIIDRRRRRADGLGRRSILGPKR